MNKIRLIILAVFLTARLASAAVLTNADIIKMSNAGLDEPVILAAIESCEPKFDTSADGLIDLSAAKVSKGVIGAMIKKSSEPAKDAAPAAPQKPAPGAEASNLLSPSEVIVLEDGKQRSMRYITPQVRSAARGLGFGGVASYAVLRGVRAMERVSNKTPSFLVSVPNQAQPESYLTLASFAVRKNESREVVIGGGYMSYSTGIHKDRVIAVSMDKSEDQSRAQKGFSIFKVTPKRSLAPGEYAVILYTGEMQGLVSGYFQGTGNSYFDFGVDP